MLNNSDLINYALHNSEDVVKIVLSANQSSLVGTIWDYGFIFTWCYILLMSVSFGFVTVTLYLNGYDNLFGPYFNMVSGIHLYQPVRTPWTLGNKLCTIILLVVAMWLYTMQMMVIPCFWLLFSVLCNCFSIYHEVDPLYPMAYFIAHRGRFIYMVWYVWFMISSFMSVNFGFRMLLSCVVFYNSFANHPRNYEDMRRILDRRND